MKKRIIACILAIGLALTAAVTYRLSVGLPAMAASSIDEAKAQLSILQSQYEILKKNSQNATEEYEDARKKYEEAKDNVENAKALKESVDAQIYTLQQEIDAAFQLLEIYESEVTRLEEDIAEKEKQIEEHQGLFVQRLRLNYEDSFTSYLEIVLSSENFSDFLYRLDVVASLLDYDKRVLKELSDAKTALEQMKEEKIALQTGQQKTYESLLEKQPLLESKLEECENALLAYQEAQRLALTAKDESEEAKKAAEAAQAAAQKQIDDAEEELRQKIIAEQERLRLEAEERARKAAEEERKRQEEERKRREAESGSSSSGEPASDSGSTTQIPYTPGSIYGIPGDGSYVGGTMMWPTLTSYSKISSYFTYRTNPVTGAAELHNGIDIPCQYGTPIYAANTGTVLIASRHSSYGYYIVIDHGGGICTLYAHNSTLLVSAGDIVGRGQQIAKAGATGVATGNHLHFSVLVSGSFVNPLKGYVSVPS